MKMPMGAVQQCAQDDTPTPPLEDPEESLLKADARKTGIPTNNTSTKIETQAGRHATVSRSGYAQLVFSPLSISCKHQQRLTTKGSTAAAYGRVRVTRKHIASPGYSRRAEGAARKPVMKETGVCDGGKVLEAGKRQFSQPFCGETAQTTVTEAAVSESVEGKSSCVSEKIPPSSSFNSSCSTEAPSERTLSVQGAKTPSPAARPASKHRLEKSALDEAFLHHLSDLSLRFPDVPTRPLPDPSKTSNATLSSDALATSKWSKGIASNLPSLRILLPSAWHRGSHRNSRRRKSTALWISRSKATKSSISDSSLSRRRAALPSKTVDFPGPLEEPAFSKAADSEATEDDTSDPDCVSRQTDGDDQHCSSKSEAESDGQRQPLPLEEDGDACCPTIATPPRSSVAPKALPPLPPSTVALSPPLGIARSKGSEKRPGSGWDTAEDIDGDGGAEDLSSWVWGEPKYIPRPGKMVSEASMMDRRQQQQQGKGRVSRVGGFTEDSGYHELSGESIMARTIFLIQ